MAVVVEEFVTIFLQETWPTISVGYATGLRIGRLRPLIGHLEEQQIRQLLDVVAIAHPIVTQDVAVVPEFLDDLVGGTQLAIQASSRSR